ncbi:MAG: tRNA (guanosine(37)-N1)-methyltransferase TrmD [Gammaproteobacteria bacterium]|nr:MAG: tRNA (guanosine(37)-N1)-methyltransferase TrmD [Gammaproteobacteria bacterium]
MRIDVVTLFPGMLEAVTAYGVTGRAVARGLLRVVAWNPRDYARDRYRRVDDRPYGGGPGMVMMVEPLRSAIRAARAAAPPEAPVIHLSPRGRLLDQREVERLAARPGLVLVASRYEGVDQRLLDAEVDEELSIGDYVLSGGELPAMVVMDAVARLLPGVLGDEASAREDSFADGLLDHPHYTRPEELEGRRVPPVLLSGDHAAIRRWRLREALGTTWLRRPELLRRRGLAPEERALLEEWLAERGLPAEDLPGPPASPEGAGDAGHGGRKGP